MIGIKKNDLRTPKKYEGCSQYWGIRRYPNRPTRFDTPVTIRVRRAYCGRYVFQSDAGKGNPKAPDIFVRDELEKTIRKILSYQGRHEVTLVFIPEVEDCNNRNDKVAA